MGDRQLKKRIALIFTFILVFTIFNITPQLRIQTIKADILLVGEEQAYDSIQEAINDSDNGDLIFVYNGTYYENLIINKTVNLIGENKKNTIIDANFLGNTINISSSNITIKNLTIKNAETHGIYLDNIDNISIENCILTDNGDCGVFLNSSTKVKIIYSDIFDNNIGLYIDEKSSKNHVYLNNFYDNNQSSKNNNNTNFWNNTIAGNFWDDIGYWDDYDCNGICDTSYIKYGVHDHYPLFHFYGSIINQNTSEIFLTIQKAIDDPDTVFGHTIFVYEDIYYENIVFSKSGIKILGEDKYNTFIDASNQDMNAFLIKNHDNITIDGFTISNSPKTIDNYSNGVLIWSYSNNSSNYSANNNIITNCIIEYNGCYGVLIQASNIRQKTDSNIISNCEIYNNGYCGIRITNDFYSSAENNTIINCEFYDNGYEGEQDHTMAAVSISPDGKTAYTKIIDCLFYFSYGQDILIEGNLIKNNIIYHNNFLSKIENVYDEGQNQWFNTNISQGNYWACYDDETEGAYDDNSDGIIDTPYDIPGGDNQDLYPLANPLGLYKPIAEANGPYTANIEDTIIFDASGSYDPDGSYLIYEWNLGNGQIKNGKQVFHNYSYPGDYTIILTVEDNYGLTSFDTTVATITSQPQEETEENTTLPIENIKPEAHAGGPYYEMTENPIQFDGSDSHDIDGLTLNYLWNFGDGNISTSMMPTHTYYKEGEYTITLTVTDENSETDTDTTYAIITKKPNYPPGKPIIKGNTTGFVNKPINFSANSTDPDGDRVQYVFNWSDSTKNTVSPFVNNKNEFNTNHTWMIGGIYVITVYALDENNAISETQLYKVEINAHKCGSLGYLIDKNGNGTYDVFYRETTGIQTPVEKKNGDCYIDINNDSEWDYIYNFSTNKLNRYESLATNNLSNLTLDTKWMILIIIVFAFSILIITKIAIIRAEKNNKETKKEKNTKEKSIYYYEEKKEIVDDKTKSIVTDEKLYELRKRLNEVLENKK